MSCKHHFPNLTDLERKEELINKLTDDTNIIANETLRRYFVTLSQYGYYDYQSVYRILALLAIKDIRTEFSQFWNECDEAIIEKALDCLYCSICAIPSPTNVVNTEINKNRKDYGSQGINENNESESSSEYLQGI